jgi:cytochrome c biogenesis factor
VTAASVPTTQGHRFGRAAMVLWIVRPFGLVVSVVALVRSARAGRVSGFAMAGLALACITIFLFLFLAGGPVGLADRCAQLGPGEYRFDDGSSLSCG